MGRSRTRSIWFRLLAQLAAVGCLCIVGTPAIAEIELTLKNAFIEKYKNRTSIEDQCLVDHSKGKANAASKDGDMHVAVRCPKEIALALVAEIMNAKDHPEAIALTKTAESDGSKVKIAGAWRIWNEHGGDERFIQGTKVSKADGTNPDHAFEVHPITQLAEFDLGASFKPIEGYVAKKGRGCLPTILKHLSENCPEQCDEKDHQPWPWPQGKRVATSPFRYA